MSNEEALPPFCPMTNGECSLPETIIRQRLSLKPYAFAALPYQEKFDDTEQVMQVALVGGNLFGNEFFPKNLDGRPVRMIEARNEKFIGQGTCKICQLCWFSDFGIAELATLNSNVLTEIGLLWGFGKKVILTLHVGYTNINEIPFDLKNFLLVTYQSMIKLGTDLEDKINFVISTL